MCGYSIGFLGILANPVLPLQEAAAWAETDALHGFVLIYSIAFFAEACSMIDAAAETVRNYSLCYTTDCK